MLDMLRTEQAHGPLVTMLMELRSLYEPEGCGIWLYSAHKEWDGLSALDMLLAGRSDEVLASIDRLTSGAYL
jgi:hypothetical protein